MPLEDFKLDDRVRHKSTGLEMDIVGIPQLYNDDEKRYKPTGKIECSFVVEGQNRNSIKEFDPSELEKLDCYPLL